MSWKGMVRSNWVVAKSRRWKVVPNRVSSVTPDRAYLVRAEVSSWGLV